MNSCAELEEAINAHDTERLLGFYANNAVTVSPMLWNFGPRSDSQRLRHDLFAFSDWAVGVSDVLVDGDRIAFMGSVTATDSNAGLESPRPESESNIGL